MTDYRRNFIAGGSFFFTVNLAERRLRLLTERIEELRAAFRETQRDHPFTRSGQCPRATRYGSTPNAVSPPNLDGSL
jgi:hypothetical protein